ncbi:hypothetical protein GY45DRAFT_412226 [Cubamyces sp. BRFM 1775]|nr:hypothetical protein GY45DRAFT_412226 [Cubamyces sp. BRFM 1775]
MEHKPPSIAEQLNDFYGSANAMNRRIRALGPEWYTLRSSMTDVVAQTFSLGVFMAIFAVVAYILISKRWRDSTTIIILFFFVPDYITLVIGWLFTLSRVIQIYAVLDGDMAFIRGEYDNLVENAIYWNAPRYTVDSGSLGYVMHGCVATTLVTADALMRVAVLCGFVLWSFTRGNNRKSWVTAALVAVPFLAACASAALHVYSTCGTEGSTPSDSNQAWAAVTSPIYMDPTTAKLTKVSTLISTVLFVQWLWEDRAAIKEQLSGGGSMEIMRYLGTTYLLPIFVNELWASFYRSHGSVNNNTALGYAFFSTMNSLIPPLTGIYPGLAIVYRRLTHSLPMPSNDPKAGVDLEQPSLSSALDVSGEKQSEDSPPVSS